MLRLGENPNFQPMNANFAILKPLEGRFKDKKQKYMAYARGRFP